MDNALTYRVLLIISLITCVYFTGLVVLSFYPHVQNNAIMIFGELLTIPFLIAILISFIICLVKIVKGYNQYIVIFLINILTIVLLTLTTILQIKG
jgi:cytochrome bd-type quinol oxidase subunit 2